MRRLSILSVAYPHAPVGPDAVGGAEQVLHYIDRALVEAGHRSIVVAQEGSQTAGELITTSAEAAPSDAAARERAWSRHRNAITAALSRGPVDLVHLHGIDFGAYWPPPPLPVLATLHLPPSWYPAEVLKPSRPFTWLHCVSHAQHAACPCSDRLLAPIENGVPVDRLSRRHAKRRFVLMLGRVCPEKGVHLGIEAARKAGVCLLIAGAVFPYEAHERYFRQEVAPRLDGMRRFIGPVGFARKRRLLAAARCLLVPSLASETSSLVAREAAACGTPVLAFPSGALKDTIEHGRTGFLVQDTDEMADAILTVDTLSGDVCRSVARERFSLEKMTDSYLGLYHRLVRGEATSLGHVA